MKIRVNEAEGAALDWLVLKALNNPVQELIWATRRHISYSTDWAHGGPIIEREKIDITYYPDGSHVDGGIWLAEYVTETQDIDQFGPTALIAAMRCYVASKLGDEVTIPEEVK